MVEVLGDGEGRVPQRQSRYLLRVAGGGDGADRSALADALQNDSPRVNGLPAVGGGAGGGHDGLEVGDFGHDGHARGVSGFRAAIAEGEAVGGQSQSGEGLGH